MKTLLAVATHHAHPVSLASIRTVAQRHRLDTVYLRDGDQDDAHEHRYARTTRKYALAQQLALAGGYDALLLIDDDQVIPDDAYTSLIALDSDVAWGLTVWRNAPHSWSAIVEAEGDDHCVPLDTRPELARAVWGGPVDVVGCGNFCTLIRRRALEATPFERRGRHGCDWYFAQDCVRHGFTLRADTGLHVGHIDGERILWPVMEPAPIGPTWRAEAVTGWIERQVMGYWGARQ